MPFATKSKEQLNSAIASLYERRAYRLLRCTGAEKAERLRSCAFVRAGPEMKCLQQAAVNEIVESASQRWCGNLLFAGAPSLAEDAAGRTRSRASASALEVERDIHVFLRKNRLEHSKSHETVLPPRSARRTHRCGPRRRSIC
jgi:hypothetical protein